MGGTLSPDVSQWESTGGCQWGSFSGTGPSGFADYCLEAPPIPQRQGDRGPILLAGSMLKGRHPGPGKRHSLGF